MAGLAIGGFGIALSGLRENAPPLATVLHLSPEMLKQAHNILANATLPVTLLNSIVASGNAFHAFIRGSEMNEKGNKQGLIDVLMASGSFLANAVAMTYSSNQFFNQ